VAQHITGVTITTTTASLHFRMPLTDWFNYALLDCSARVHVAPHGQVSGEHPVVTAGLVHALAMRGDGALCRRQAVRRYLDRHHPTRQLSS